MKDKFAGANTSSILNLIREPRTLWTPVDNKYIAKSMPRRDGHQGKRVGDKILKKNCRNHIDYIQFRFLKSLICFHWGRSISIVVPVFLHPVLPTGHPLLLWRTISHASICHPLSIPSLQLHKFPYCTFVALTISKYKPLSGNFLQQHTLDCCPLSKFISLSSQDLLIVWMYFKAGEIKHDIQTKI